MIPRRLAYRYLGIDFEDDATEEIVDNLIRVADSYLASSLGEAFPRDDPRAQQIALLVLSDLYDNRSMTTGNASDKVGGTARKLVQDFSLQLRLETTAASEEAAGG